MQTVQVQCNPAKAFPANLNPFTKVHCGIAKGPDIPL